MISDSTLLSRPAPSLGILRYLNKVWLISGSLSPLSLSSFLSNRLCVFYSVFNSKEELADHMERHRGPLPYFCHVCDYRFRNRTQLNVHLPRHSDEKPFNCKVNIITIIIMSFIWRIKSGHKKVNAQSNASDASLISSIEIEMIYGDQSPMNPWWIPYQSM